jgi:type I site-specific restriction endonuclease
MPNNQGKGFVDYVLWGDDGKPLGLVEAKRTAAIRASGQQQAKLYADCLERQFGQRPLIFYSNGYEHWLWDDTNYPPRAVQGFYKKAELELRSSGADAQAAAGGSRSTRPSSSATTRRAASAASPRPSSATTTARRCW